MKIRHIVERVHPHRLGRHVEHDSRSRGFGVVHDAARPLLSKVWGRHCKPFDQGDIGSCTGNAMAGLLMTEPYFVPGRVLTEEDALRLYKLATRLDKIPGHYLPEDTGSSGLAVAKAAHHSGLLKAGYRHAFGFAETCHALQHGPVIVGINWYEGFDQPHGSRAELTIGGEVRGGHEIEIHAIDVELKEVRLCNSWGEGWGDHGYAVFSFDTFARLLSEDGDVIQGST
jgi:hypothetical protein